MTQSPMLSDHTYIKIGGPVDELIEAKTAQDLIDAVVACRQQQKRFFIIGSGSNILFSDAGFRGTIILNQTKAFDFDADSHMLTAESGCLMNFLVHQTVAQSLSGLEGYLGLPGTLGGAIYNNSHFKQELIGDVIKSVTVLDEENQVVVIPKADLEFAYDYSRFHHTKEIILSAVLQLTPGNAQEISAKAKGSLEFRHTRQPLSMPSAGSFFKNPENGPSAGALIDQAGLKNTAVGGAMVSPVHANFIVNTGGATAKDVKQLADKIKSVVQETHGVSLEPEVFIINEYGERV
jgi:UDP-N-acetylmuramate dehydrogenase